MTSPNFAVYVGSPHLTAFSDEWALHPFLAHVRNEEHEVSVVLGWGEATHDPDVVVFDQL
jgi:hypothetical protein